MDAKGESRKKLKILRSYTLNKAFLEFNPFTVGCPLSLEGRGAG
jgi:hypothetical protein